MESSRACGSRNRSRKKTFSRRDSSVVKFSGKLSSLRPPQPEKRGNNLKSGRLIYSTWRTIPESRPQLCKWIQENKVVLRNNSSLLHFNTLANIFETTWAIRGVPKPIQTRRNLLKEIRAGNIESWAKVLFFYFIFFFTESGESTGRTSWFSLLSLEGKKALIQFLLGNMPHSPRGLGQTRQTEDSLIE